MAGKAKQTSVETPAIMSFLRPAASTALANRGSSNALTVVRAMIGTPSRASVSSGDGRAPQLRRRSGHDGRHAQNPGRLRQPDNFMLQLPYRDVSDSSEKPDLMIDEK